MSSCNFRISLLSTVAQNNHEKEVGRQAHSFQGPQC